MIGQIGTAQRATEFLNSLRDNPAIAPVVFVVSGRSFVQPHTPYIIFTNTLQINLMRNSRTSMITIGSWTDG
jgi:hypothetical protein